MEIDAALDGIYDPSLVNNMKAEAQIAYEERIVKKIMTTAGLASQIKVLLNAVRQITGKPRLSFAFFESQYPSFPVWLAIKRIGFVHQTTIPDLFNRFPSLKITEAWAEAADECTREKPVALVFDYPGVTGGQLVCHNWNVDLDLRETRICRRTGYGRGELLWIERFEPFFDNVLALWDPSLNPTTRL